jgi:hypothetical protein
LSHSIFGSLKGTWKKYGTNIGVFQYCGCIFFFLNSWDRPDDGYKTVAGHVTDLLNSKTVGRYYPLPAL